LSGTSILDRYSGLLTKLKSDYALDALSNPKSEGTFEFGKHVGFVAGLNRAEQLLHEAMGQEADDDGTK
jgi:hypothetical protein